MALFENLKVASYLLKYRTLKVSIFYEESTNGCISYTLSTNITFPDFVHLFLQEYSTLTVRLLSPGDLKVDYPIMTFFEKRKTIFFMQTDQQHSWFNYTRFNRMKLPDLSRNSLLLTCEYSHCTTHLYNEQ